MRSKKNTGFLVPAAAFVILNVPIPMPGGNTVLAQQEIPVITIKTEAAYRENKAPYETVGSYAPAIVRLDNSKVNVYYISRGTQHLNTVSYQIGMDSIRGGKIDTEIPGGWGVDGVAGLSGFLHEPSGKVLLRGFLDQVTENGNSFREQVFFARAYPHSEFLERISIKRQNHAGPIVYPGSVPTFQIHTGKTVDNLFISVTWKSGNTLRLETYSWAKEYGPFANISFQRYVPWELPEELIRGFYFPREAVPGATVFRKSDRWGEGRPHLAVAVPLQSSAYPGYWILFAEVPIVAYPTDNPTGIGFALAEAQYYKFVPSWAPHNLPHGFMYRHTVKSFPRIHMSTGPDNVVYTSYPGEEQTVNGEKRSQIFRLQRVTDENNNLAYRVMASPDGSYQYSGNQGTQTVYVLGDQQGSYRDIMQVDLRYRGELDKPDEAYAHVLLRRAGRAVRESVDIPAKKQTLKGIIFGPPPIPNSAAQNGRTTVTVNKSMTSANTRSIEKSYGGFTTLEGSLGGFVGKGNRHIGHTGTESTRQGRVIDEQHSFTSTTGSQQTIRRYGTAITSELRFVGYRYHYVDDSGNLYPNADYFYDLYPVAVGNQPHDFYITDAMKNAGVGIPGDLDTYKVLDADFRPPWALVSGFDSWKEKMLVGALSLTKGATSKSDETTFSETNSTSGIYASGSLEAGVKYGHPLFDIKFQATVGFEGKSTELAGTSTASRFGVSVDTSDLIGTTAGTLKDLSFQYLYLSGARQDYGPTSHFQSALRRFSGEESSSERTMNTDLADIIDPASRPWIVMYRVLSATTHENLGNVEIRPGPSANWDASANPPVLRVNEGTTATLQIRLSDSAKITGTEIVSVDSLGDPRDNHSLGDYEISVANGPFRFSSQNKNVYQDVIVDVQRHYGGSNEAYLSFSSDNLVGTMVRVIQVTPTTRTMVALGAKKPDVEVQPIAAPPRAILSERLTLEVASLRALANDPKLPSQHRSLITKKIDTMDKRLLALNTQPTGATQDLAAVQHAAFALGLRETSDLELAVTALRRDGRKAELAEIELAEVTGRKASDIRQALLDLAKDPSVVRGLTNYLSQRESVDLEKMQQLKAARERAYREFLARERTREATAERAAKGQPMSRDLVTGTSGPPPPPE